MRPYGIQACSSKQMRSQGKRTKILKIFWHGAMEWSLPMKYAASGELDASASNALKLRLVTLSYPRESGAGAHALQNVAVSRWFQPSPPLFSGEKQVYNLAKKMGINPPITFLQKVLATTIYGATLPQDSLLNGASVGGCKSTATPN
jgi:hypothetical protein